MSFQSLRQTIYYSVINMRGQPLGRMYNHYYQEYVSGIPEDTIWRSLVSILEHSQQNVPYYAHLMKNLGDDYKKDPFAYLKDFPILTKQILNYEFDRLKSSTLKQAKWSELSSGGSTGEPSHFIQDFDFAVHNGAIKFLINKIVGVNLGEKTFFLWGSDQDLSGATASFKSRVINKIANWEFLSVVNLSSDSKREMVEIINKKKPQLIVGYVWALNELARFIEQRKIKMSGQYRIISTAGMLYPTMRETIEKAFQCKVYNRYGSRETGDIAIERPGSEGLWVVPWGNYIEIVDSDGNPVPDGQEGDILVTSLINYAMPLIRYRIGDRGIISSTRGKKGNVKSQEIQSILGRSIDLFINKHGKTIDSHYFLDIFFDRKWVKNYQVIQKQSDRILIKIVRAEGSNPARGEIEEIISLSKKVMYDTQCEISIEFVDDIEKDASGKYRFIRSEEN